MSIFIKHGPNVACNCISSYFLEMPYHFNTSISVWYGNKYIFLFYVIDINHFTITWAQTSKQRRENGILIPGVDNETALEHHM